MKNVELVIDICKTGSISKSAQKHQYQQQTVSNILRAFEKEHQIELFHHKQHKLLPRPIIKCVLPMLEEIAKEEAVLHQFIADEKTAAAKMAVSIILKQMQLAPLYKHALLKDADDELIAIYMNDDACESLVLDGEVQMAVYCEPLMKEEYHYVHLFSCQPGIVVFENNPLYRQKTISTDQLIGMNLFYEPYMERICRQLTDRHPDFFDQIHFVEKEPMNCCVLRNDFETSVSNNCYLTVDLFFPFVQRSMKKLLLIDTAPIRYYLVYAKKYDSIFDSKIMDRLVDHILPANIPLAANITDLI